MKRILLVSHHFPPDSAVGGIRTAKFAKYLPRFGWEPVVLTVKEDYHPSIDDLIKEEPTYPVIRSAFVRNQSHYYRKLKRLLFGDAVLKPSALPGLDIDNRKATLRDWFNAVTAFPDEDTGWIPFAFFQGRKAIRDFDIECVFSSGPPHSTHLLGAWLAKSARIPWIADFRDPYFLGNRKNPAYEKLDKRLEAYFMSRASFVLSTTQRLTDELMRRYPAHEHKFVTLPNGYDPDDFLNVPLDRATRFAISYLGTLYRSRNPEPVLRAIASLIEEEKLDRGRVALRFIGDCAYAAGRPMEALASEHHLTDNVEILPWVSKRQAFEIMAQSHVLLLLAENQELMIPAKVYDYLGAGADVLALTEDGATADLLREVGQGNVHAPNDLDGIKKSIEQSYRRYLENPRRDRASSNTEGNSLSRYDRRALTQELAELLDSAVLERGSERPHSPAPVA